MPPAESAPVSGTSRPLPRVLLLIATALLVARVATGVWEEKRPPQSVDLVAWVDIGNAIAEAQRTQKPVLYDFSAEWCGPCQLMAREVFADAQSARKIQQSFVPVRVIDRKQEQGQNSPEVEQLQKTYGVTGFPTLVVARPRDPHFEAMSGYRGRDATVSWLARNAMIVHMKLLNTSPDSVLRR